LLQPINLSVIKPNADGFKSLSSKTRFKKSLVQDLGRV